MNPVSPCWRTDETTTVIRERLISKQRRYTAYLDTGSLYVRFALLDEPLDDPQVAVAAGKCKR